MKPFTKRDSRIRPWEDVLRAVNAPPAPPGQRWTQSRLLRAVKVCVRDGFLPEAVLGRSGRRDTDTTPQAICNRLEAMRERTPRDRTSWQRARSAIRRRD